MTDDVEERARGILVDVFGLDPAEVGPATSPDTVEAWDSLQHLTVVLSLEEEFDVAFDDEETVTMTSLALIVLTVREKLAA